MDYNENDPIELISDVNNDIFCRINFRGKNMIFEDGPNYNNLYFNPVTIHFSFNKPEDEEKVKENLYAI